MTTVSNDSLVTKVVAGVVGLAAAVFMLGLSAVPAAHAQQKSNAELRAQIQSLLDTISNLQARLDGQSSGTSADPYMNCDPAVYQNQMSQGDRSQAVKSLQQFLNMSADTRVAASGPGSPGNETMYYGSLTSQAVTKFQEKYSASVLAPLGLSSGTGYWGSSSMDKARQLCMQNDTGGDQQDDGQQGDNQNEDTGTSTDENGQDDQQDDEQQLSGGEATLSNFDISSGNDSEVSEGGSGEVADVEFDVDNGDVRVSRMDIGLGLANNPSNADDEPWEVFSKVTVLGPNGNEIASKQVSDESDWIDDETEFSTGGTDFYEVRLADLNTVVKEGETAQMTIVVETQNGIDGISNNPQWEVALDDEAIRSIDGAGINQYVPTNISDAISFDLQEEGQNEELSFSESSDNPDSQVLKVEDDQTSDEYKVFSFEAEAEESDISIESLPVTFNTYSSSTYATTTYDDVVNDAHLVVGGQEYDDFTETRNGSSTENVDGEDRTVSTSTLDFEFNDELTVEKGNSKKMTLVVEFNQQDNNYDEGSGVSAELTDANIDNIDAQGKNDLGTNQLDGTATGEVHDLRTEGLIIEPKSTNASVNYDYDGNGNSKASYEVKYTVRAFENDFYVPRGATSTATSSDVTSDFGARYTLRDNNNNVVSTSTNAKLSSSDSDTVQSNSGWSIEEGDTETFTLNVTKTSDQGLSGFHSIQLEAARYGDQATDVDNNSGDETEVKAIPLSDFETSAVDL